MHSIDGVILQRHITNPIEVMTWFKYDLIVSRTLHSMIGDEFLDSPLSKEGATLVTAFVVLKKCR